MIELPSGVCDCHMHVFGKPDQYPFNASRSYTPPEASLESFRAVMALHRVDRAVFVQASPYGIDNSAALDAARALGSNGRVVAAIDNNITDRALDALDAAGTRGARLILNAKHLQVPETLASAVTALASRLSGSRWHIEIESPLAITLAASEALQCATVPIVIDHMARISLSTASDALDRLADLLHADHLWMKLSGVDRMTKRESDFSEARDMVAEMLCRIPIDRLLWGSDWPHTGYHDGGAGTNAPSIPFRAVGYGELLNWFGDIVTDPAVQRTILVENPEKLYGFTPLTKVINLLP